MSAMTKTAIERVFEIVGSEAEVARRLKVSSEAVRKWKKTLPPPRARQLEDLTGGAVTRYDLRPDIFGEAPAMVRAPDPEAPDPKSGPLDGEGERRSDQVSVTGSSAFPVSSEAAGTLLDEEAA